MLIAGALFNLFYLKPHIQIKLAIPPSRSVSHHFLDSVQLDCLARNVFFEARGESAEGKAMVAFVTIQRTKSAHFPDTICRVVHEGSMDGGKGCQFSWVCNGKNHTIDFYNKTIDKEWQQSYKIARMVMLGILKPPIDMDGITNYHAQYVHPKWARDHKDFKFVAIIGHHLFYRWKKADMPKIQFADI